MLDFSLPHTHTHTLLHYSCLAHRLRQWLSVGSDLVAPQLHRLTSTPCLVIAGTVDNLLPSYEEAQRLRRELPDCEVGRRSVWGGACLMFPILMLETMTWGTHRCTSQ